MKNKELKKLNRKELLELLLEQTKENERLQQELDKANAALADRDLKIREAGTLANAAVAINGILEVAQATANQYLDNIKLMEKETQDKCEELLRKAKEEAERAKENEEEKSQALNTEK